jgi:hypothetical protein
MYVAIIIRGYVKRDMAGEVTLTDVKQTCVSKRNSVWRHLAPVTLISLFPISGEKYDKEPGFQKLSPNAVS